MQAQLPLDPYVGLWSRLEGFRPDELGRLITERRAVRGALMLATIHLVSDRDFVALRPVVQAVLERVLYASSPFGRRIGGVDTVMRYLASFGPATAADVQAWSGLTGLREVTERLRPRLRTFRDERGRELFDVPDAPLPDPDTPAPPRFLPVYDNVFLGHADRTRIGTEEHRRRLMRSNRDVRTLLVDGFVRGTWNITRQRDRATLVIEPLERLSRKDRDAVTAEGAELLRFMAGEAQAHDVRFVAPA